MLFIEYNSNAVKAERTAINTENNDSLKSSYSCSHQHSQAFQVLWYFLSIKVGCIYLFSCKLA